MKFDTAPPRGMKDQLPAEVELRDRATATILATYRRYGFRRIETPALENLRLLQGSGGGENEKLIYKVLKRGAKLDAAATTREVDLADLGLRFDDRRMIERDTGDGEQQHRDEAHGAADPVPLAELTHPLRAAIGLRGPLGGEIADVDVHWLVPRSTHCSPRCRRGCCSTSWGSARRRPRRPPRCRSASSTSPTPRPSRPTSST